MILLCHRCCGDLSLQSGSRFCPHCGAPQLLLSPAVSGRPEEGTAITGAASSPRPRAIAWRTALQASMLVAGIMVLLLLAAARIPLFSLPWLLWTGSGALIALRIYHYRNTGARMDVAIGARIGASLGVLMIASLSLALAISGAVTRFYLHGMGNFDHELHVRMTEQIQAAIIANPAASDIAKEQLLPGLIAGSLLLGLGVASLLLFIVSVLGGALGGLLQERRSSTP